MAGVNGAGKSTFYSSDFNLDVSEKINMDEVVREIGNWRNSADVIQAGKIVVRRIKGYFDNGVSFSQETTLCGGSIMKNIQTAKRLGYSIELYYVGVNTVEIAKERVKYRVACGGHGIAEEDIERRYLESFQNLKKVLPLCDKAFIYDNTEVFKIVALFENGNCIKQSEVVPKWYEYINKGGSYMGKFVISEAKKGFKFNLVAGNGEVIASSQVYKSAATAKKGVASVAANAPIAAIENQTVKDFQVEKNPKFEVYKDKKGEFRFRLKAKNGQIIATGEGYAKLDGCM